MRSAAIYWVASSLTALYALALASAYWFGPLRAESSSLLRLQAAACAVVTSIGLPAFAMASETPGAWRAMIRRAAGLGLVLGIAAYFAFDPLAAQFSAEGAPGWLAWFASFALVGCGGVGIAYGAFGAPITRRRKIGPAEHIGALRPGETWLRGARVLRAPKEGSPAAGQLSVGGIPLSWSRETQHIFVSGASGTGKTQIIESFLRSIRERAQKSGGKPPRVVLLDPGGAYYSRFGEPGDLLLNPFDARSAAWSPFQELARPEDYARIAAAFVPLHEGPGREWSLYGRKILADTLRAMDSAKIRSTCTLFGLLDGPPEELSGFLARAGIEGLTGAGNEKMFANAKATIAPFVEVFGYLPAEGDLSVRRWIRCGDEAADDGWLFVTYRDDQVKLLRQFVAAMADLAIVETLSLPPDDGLPPEERRRLFFVIDELDSIGVISELKDALAKLRKFGGVCVLGLQTIPQLRAIYGREIASAILGNVATHGILRPQDGETAEEMSRLLGDQDIERVSFLSSRSTGDSTSSLLSGGGSQSSTGASENEQRQVVTRRAVLASELQAMENLHGVLIRPASPHHPFCLEHVEMAALHSAFEPKESS